MTSIQTMHYQSGEFGKDVGPRDQRTPMGHPYISPISRGYLWVSHPQESLENTTNTMGTLLGVHPIVP